MLFILFILLIKITYSVSKLFILNISIGNCFKLLFCKSLKVYYIQNANNLYNYVLITYYLLGRFKIVIVKIFTVF